MPHLRVLPWRAGRGPAVGGQRGGAAACGSCSGRLGLVVRGARASSGELFRVVFVRQHACACMRMSRGGSVATALGAFGARLALIRARARACMHAHSSPLSVVFMRRAPIANYKPPIPKVSLLPRTSKMNIFDSNRQTIIFSNAPWRAGQPSASEP